MSDLIFKSVNVAVVRAIDVFSYVDWDLDKREAFLNWEESDEEYYLFWSDKSLVFDYDFSMLTGFNIMYSVRLDDIEEAEKLVNVHLIRFSDWYDNN